MSVLGKYPKDNTVILNKFIVGQYHDEELDEMVGKLSSYYQDSENFSYQDIQDIMEDYMNSK